VSRLDPDELYSIAPDLPDLRGAVLIQALDGFIDAGAAKRLAREHLQSVHGSTTVADFDVDALLDYRARRPMMVFDEDHWASYESPQLEIQYAHDLAGTPFLLLVGPEPDVYWETFAMAIARLIVTFEVSLTVGLNSIPMAVPHTRPLGIISHGSRPELIASNDRWVGKVQVPSSMGHLLEYRLGASGRDAAGMAVAVPHYLAETAYPAAAVRLLEGVAALTDLQLDLSGLIAQAAEVRAEVDKQVDSADEVRAVVGALEQQYDSTLAGTSKLMADMGGSLPTADELGEEFQKYLAGQGEDEA